MLVTRALLILESQTFTEKVKYVKFLPDICQEDFGLLTHVTLRTLRMQAKYARS